MGGTIEFRLNGRLIRVQDCSLNTTLLEYLRNHGLTGAKEGCAEGDCGACSVAVIDRDAEGHPAYRAINSCLVPVCLLAGREIVSVEGISRPDQLHPVQQKMVECHGSQCGYCTPGFICSLLEGYYRNDLHTADDLDDQLSGNLCRCTGYRSITEAARAAFAERSSTQANDSFAKRLNQAVAEPGAAAGEFANERFLRPGSLAELLRVRKEHPDAVIVAGATELGLDITKRYKRFPFLISVEAVPELREIKSTNTAWHIGGAATLSAIRETVAREFPALDQMLRVFGSRQIRNRATMGGNLVTASPIGDSAPILLALDAEIILAAVSGERTVPIDQFVLS